MDSVLFLSFIGSLIICMALIPALSASALRLQFIDLPRERHMHEEPVAKVGGIAFAVATFVAVLVWAPKDPMILSSLLGGAVILLFGIWDDRVGLTHRMKFAGQILAAAVVIGFAGIRISSIPFVDDFVLPTWVTILLTMFVVVGVTNAVNLSDGLDGLAGGLSLISFAGIAYLAYQANELLLVLLTVSVLGGLLGFLRFNTYPARIFMGDAGSQFLGHYLAVAALLLTDATRTVYSPLLALFLWGVPLLDTVGVMVQRCLEGRSPFVGDRSHVHHKLLAAGLTHGQAVTVIYLVHAVMVSSAYLLRWQSDALLAAVYLVFASAIFSLYLYRRTAPGDLADAGPSLVEQPHQERRSSGRRVLGEWSVSLLSLAVPVYLIGSIAVPREIPSEAGLIAGALATCVFGSLLLRRATPWAVRSALYIGSTCLMYYGEVFPRTMTADVQVSLNVGIAILAVLVVVAICQAGEERFQTTPLDYLIVLMAGVMPFLPEMTINSVPLGILTAKLLVLFFAFELLLHLRASSVTRLGLVSLTVLSGVMLRACWS
jgi:UDP-GlcNAc:undecaprenyl-phosphate/decaprenyl-phosphate GlcNAc-1-phosphate transferase